MGAGAWKPAEGCEGFTVSVMDDVGSDVTEDLLMERLDNSLADAGFELLDLPLGNPLIAKNEYLKVAVTGWQGDFAIELQPNIALSDHPIYDPDTGFINPIMADRLQTAFSQTYNLLVNDLINDGFETRYRTSAYTTSAHSADPDFNRNECIAELNSLMNIPSTATMFKELFTGSSSRNYSASLISQLSEQSRTYSGELGGMVALFWKDEIYGIPLGMSGNPLEDGDDVHVCHLKTLTDYLKVNNPSFIEELRSEYGSFDSELPSIIDYPYIGQIEITNLILRCEIDDVSTSRDIPLLVFLRNDEVAEVCDKEITLWGWDSDVTIDPLNIDDMPYSHYSMLFDNGCIRDDAISNDLLTGFKINLNTISITGININMGALEIHSSDDPLTNQVSDSDFQPN